MRENHGVVCIRTRVEINHPEEVLARILNDAITEGTDSSEESDLDRQLENGIEDSR